MKKDKFSRSNKDKFRRGYMSGKDNSAKLEAVKIFNVEVMTDSQITKWFKHGTRLSTALIPVSDYEDMRSA